MKNPPLQKAIAWAVARYIATSNGDLPTEPSHFFCKSLNKSGFLVVETEQYESMRRKCELYDEMTRKEDV